MHIGYRSLVENSQAEALSAAWSRWKACTFHAGAAPAAPIRSCEWFHVPPLMSKMYGWTKSGLYICICLFLVGYCKTCFLEELVLVVDFQWAQPLLRDSQLNKNCRRINGFRRYRGLFSAFSVVLFHSPVYPLVIKHGNGKSSLNGGCLRKITDKWSIFHCHVWILRLEQTVSQVTMFMDGFWSINKLGKLQRPHWSHREPWFL